ncbi:MAG: hypothetical protein NW201_08735 [Gemmatimonadales bacterium]|nr:hypothetical protein [Gemmatimonadales bacterium]
MPYPRARWALAAGLACLATPAAAQKDYRNLDDDRPLLTEDALPIERGALELMLPLRADRSRGAAAQVAAFPELMWGAFRGGHLGLKLPLVTAESPASLRRWGPASAELLAFANLRGESATLPALSVRADVGVPLGGVVGGRRVTAQLKGIATRSLGASRVHVNAAWTFGAGTAAGLPLEAPHRWTTSLAVDHTLWRRALLIGAEAIATRPVDGAPVQVNVGAGLRWQLDPHVVLDAGVTRRLRATGPDLGVTAGLAWSWPTQRLGPRPRQRGAATPPASEPAVVVHDDRMYPAGAFNWAFLRRFPDAARLFNAFDYGHAILYERLWNEPGLPRAALDSAEYAFLATDLLRRPPALPVAEEAVFPAYDRIAYRAARMFDWAHVLHRQIYDIYAEPGRSDSARAAEIERLTDHYLANVRDAFTPEPKAMELMDEQPFSQSFRRGYPRFNGLIWAYHWLQVGLYEPFLATADTAAQRRLVDDVVRRFLVMVDGDSTALPSVMPMTAAVAPRFAARHPRAAMIFDNLHMMHDIISDVLVDPRVPRREKGAEIRRQLDAFQRGDRDTIDAAHWAMMADHMGGVERMGGVAVP